MSRRKPWRCQSRHRTGMVVQPELRPYFPARVRCTVWWYHRHNHSAHVQPKSPLPPGAPCIVIPDGANYLYWDRCRRRGISAIAERVVRESHNTSRCCRYEEEPES